MLKNLNNVIGYFKAYTQYDLKREILAWLKIFVFYLPITIPITIAAIAVFVYVKPFPSGQTFLAIGQTGSLSDQMGKSFADYFKKNGLEIQEINTAGLQSGLHQLDDSGSEINASFVTSGTATSTDFPNLVSLGTVDIAPLWIFYRGNTVSTDDPFEYYRDKRINVGREGTVTNKLFTRLMELNNPGTGSRVNFLELSHAEAAQQLRDGQIQAMFIVDGLSSPIIQSLLNDPTIKLMNFPLADAYVRKMPFLQKVAVPKASIDINNVRPEANITLLASGINLLVEKNVHPTVQWALLFAAQNYNLKTQNFFTETGSFPAYADKTYPLSFIADDFYTHGTPGVFKYLPLKFAALIQNIWIILLALFLVALPFLKKLLSFRSDTSQKLLWKNFWELRFLEDQLKDATSASDTEAVLCKLQKLENKSTNTWVEGQHMRHRYNLKRCVIDVIKDAQKQLNDQRTAQN